MFDVLLITRLKCKIWFSFSLTITVLMAVSDAGELGVTLHKVNQIEDEDELLDEKTAYERRGKFPETLSSFGFGFNNLGQLRKIDPQTGELTDEPFVFDITEDRNFNQKRYEALGEVISHYLYDVMESEMKLRRLDVPLGQEYLKKTFIYGTDDCLVNNDRLLILLQGSGVVRAGQWARSLIINDGLETGSQIPYINNARAQGYAVLVLNPNESQREFDGETYTIPKSQTPIEHFNYVWKTYIKPSRARYIAIVAHSYGGVVVINAAHKFYSDFYRRVYAIAMTDSAHISLRSQNVSDKTSSYLQKVSRNWIADSSAVDTPMYTPPKEITNVSAGHSNHCMTSSSAITSVFAFLDERYRKMPGNEEL